MKSGQNAMSESFQEGISAAGAPDETALLLQTVTDRLVELFPTGTAWELERGPLDLIAVAVNARDHCLSMAVALERQRQTLERSINDGR